MAFSTISFYWASGVNKKIFLQMPSKEAGLADALQTLLVTSARRVETISKLNVHIKLTF